MRLVLDTNVLVAAIRSSTGASAALLTESFAGKATLLVSVAVVLEYEDVCLRPAHRAVSKTSEAAIQDLLHTLIAIAEPVAIHFRWRPQLRDASDEMVLEVAVHGRADAIVTFNHRHYGQMPARFGIEVLSPGEALRRISK